MVVVVAAVVRGGSLELVPRLQLGLELLFKLRWRVPHGPFVGGAMIHDTSAYLFGDNRLEVHFKCGNKLVIVGFLEYRCTRARNEVDTLSGNNIEAVLQVRAAVSSMGRNANLNLKDACRLTMSRSWLAVVVGGLSGRDVITVLRGSMSKVTT